MFGVLQLVLAPYLAFKRHNRQLWKPSKLFSKKSSPHNQTVTDHTPCWVNYIHSICGNHHKHLLTANASLVARRNSSQLLSLANQLIVSNNKVAQTMTSVVEVHHFYGLEDGSQACIYAGNKQAVFKGSLHHKWLIPSCPHQLTLSIADPCSYGNLGSAWLLKTVL